MKKTMELPFIGAYGLEHEHPFRYFFLKERNKDLQAYKDAILKCLKYDVLYVVFSDYKSGHKSLDALHPQQNEVIDLGDNKLGYVFNESVTGSTSGELIVVAKILDDEQSIDLTLYDRNTVLELVQMTNEETNKEETTYALVDKIIESKVKLTKGKKLSSNNIKVYETEEKHFPNEYHSYENSIKVINEVKEKGQREYKDPTHLTYEVKEKSNKR